MIFLNVCGVMNLVSDGSDYHYPLYQRHGVNTKQIFTVHIRSRVMFSQLLSFTGGGSQRCRIPLPSSPLIKVG